MIMSKEKQLSKVVRIEKIDEDYEKFILNINEFNIEMFVSKKEQPKFFNYLVDAFNNDTTFDLRRVDISQ